MRALQPEFAEMRRPGSVVWWLVSLLAATSVGLWMMAWAAQREVDRLRLQLEDVKMAQADAIVPANPARVVPYAESARELLLDRSSGWIETLRALEVAAAPGITPLSVEIANRDHSARAEVEFSDFGTLLTYLETLNAGHSMSHWQLISTQSGAGERPAVAVLQRGW